MKKLLCLLLALVMILSLAACSDSDSDSGSKRKKKDKDNDDEQIVAEKDEEEPTEAPTEKTVDLAEEILGTWNIEITFTEEMLGVEGVNIEDLPVSFTFTEDGEVVLSFSDEAVAIFEEQLLDAMVEMMYVQMEAEGMGREEVDELFESYYGTNVADYMKAALEEADVMSMLTDLEEAHDYEIEGDKLIIDGTEMTAEIKGDKLTISDCEDDDFWATLGLEAPIVLERN